MSQWPARAATSGNGRPACTSRLMNVCRSVCRLTPSNLARLAARTTAWLQRTLVIIAVTLPAGAFECVFGVCEAEVDHPTQTFMGESTEVEVRLPASGLGEFKVQVKHLDVDVDNPPVEVTLTIQVGGKTGTDTVVEKVKDPGERLQFEVDDDEEDDEHDDDHDDDDKDKDKDKDDD